MGIYKGYDALNEQDLQASLEVETLDLEYIVQTLGDELQAFSGKKIVITGAGGFLGFYLTKAIVHWNQEQPKDAQVSLIASDNFLRGKPAWLEALADEQKLTLINFDVTDPWPDSAVNAHFYIHAATIASPIYYRQFPIETMDANVLGIRTLLDLAVERKTSAQPVEGILFFSTSEIYGDPDPQNIPTAESYRGNVSCTGPRACYDESKRYGETLCVNFAQQHGVPVKTARPFNNYGPGLSLSDRRAPPDFARNVLEGNDITLLSDGSPTRTFCYVADAVIGYFKILLRGAAGEAYNIGNDAPEISIRDFATRMIGIAQQHLDYNGQLKFENSDDEHYLTDNPQRRCPDIAKARAALEFAPGIELDEGIRRSLMWYRAQLDSPSS
ncbi:MAG: NAD-dependent epimerase/dehydratase family protein [Gammaproteobacteria bacterium]|nr:NAD-dependent epimerase/dehydratase family protein [Gammaproteobacteria bacterium]